MEVPFVDLRVQEAALAEEIRDQIHEVIRTSAFAGGPFVAAFEAELAAFCECDFAVGVGSGTEALWLTLLAMGVGVGDEVITVPNTFIATVEAISMCGARPVFVDIDERTHTMDPALLERAITARTKAVIAVHLYGHPADMEPILEIGKRHHLYVIEDACQAHGALYKGRKVAGLGHAGCFSFYPTKNLGAFGEAGAVLTNDRQLKERIACLRDHGQTARYQHRIVGWNGRMDGIQAAVLRAKLKRLAADNERRRDSARLYQGLLAEVRDLILPTEADYARAVYHLFVVRIRRDRAELMRHLSARGIGCLIHYPTPIHLQEAYRSLELPEGSFPVSEGHAQEILSLPMFPGLTPNQVATVAQAIRSVLDNRRAEPVDQRCA
jgi:dTDP-4-amino-4,6-dideoxygalactose transaminase